MQYGTLSSLRTPRPAPLRAVFLLLEARQCLFEGLSSLIQGFSSSYNVPEGFCRKYMYERALATRSIIQGYLRLALPSVGAKCHSQSSPIAFACTKASGLHHPPSSAESLFADAGPYSSHNGINLWRKDGERRVRSLARGSGRTEPPGDLPQIKQLTFYITTCNGPRQVQAILSP